MNKEKYYLIQSHGYPQNEKYKVFQIDVIQNICESV